ncbi:MAG: PhoU domain-containing protein [Desulfurococcales archaeon]|jgi:phosphate transport system protein|nr:PhoU domain-containing protein [Desulfurococcales archaeon]
MRPIDAYIARLEARLRELSTISENIVEGVVTLRESLGDIRERVDEVKRRRLEIHSSVIEIIARFQPTASDLRELIASLEISYGLYRFARYALDISTILATVLEPSSGECELRGSLEAADHVKEMVRKSIEAFLKRDKALARSVIDMDKMVDEKLFQTLSRASKSTDLCSTLDLLILMYLERIADHSVYIAQETIEML